MCVRMAARGWKMACIDTDMGFHDARMTKFSQWWKRSTRCGHAYAEGAALHGKGPSQHNVKQLRSVLFWGVAVPLWVVDLLAAGLGRFPVDDYRSHRLAGRLVAAAGPCVSLPENTRGRREPRVVIFLLLHSRQTAKRAWSLEILLASCHWPEKQNHRILTPCRTLPVDNSPVTVRS